MIILNKELNTVHKDEDIGNIKEKFSEGCDILYVVKKDGMYIGCIARKELQTSLERSHLIINYESIKLQHAEDEKEKAEQLFQRYTNIHHLPVIDKNGSLLYEYVRVIGDKSFDSAQYWEERYKNGGNSGEGSYNELAEFKAEVLNEFIQKNKIHSIIEWGFGDGNQLSMLNIQSYIGYDVSETIWKMCKEKFLYDKSKEFRHYDGSRIENPGIYDMGVSLDVLYHLVEKNKFEDYLYNLFHSSDRFVCIYSSDYRERQEDQHVLRRRFTEYVKKRFPEWELVLFIRNPFLHNGTNSNFYFYGKNLQDNI